MHASHTFFEQSPSDDLKHEGEITMETFRWLLVFGFPASVAAARLMPEVFSDVIDDGIQFARRITRSPFGQATS